MITRRRTLVAATATAAATVAAPAVLRAQAPTTWIVYSYVPAATLAPARVFQEIVERVSRETNGGLQLKYHLGGALTIKGTDITTAVGDNVIQIGDDGMQQGNVPITGILRLPMLVTNRQEFDKALAVMKPYVDKAYDKRGATLLSTYYYPLQIAWSSKKLTSLDDFKGQKIRVTSPEQGEFIKRLGGVPVTIGAPEVPSALDRGVVDGVLTANAGGGVIWKDMLKFNLRLGINYFNSVVIANRERLDKLPADVRTKLLKVVRDNLPLMTAQMQTDEDGLTRKFAEGGMTITSAGPADTAQAAALIAPYWDEWARSRGAEAQEALGKVRAALGR